MDEIKALGSVEEIYALLEKTKAEESTVQHLIHYHLQSEDEFLKNPNTFDSLVPINVEFAHMNKEFVDIGTNIQKSYDSINTVDEQITTCGSEAVQSSMKVKQCDLLKTNAQQCLTIVNALIDLNKSVSGIQTSLQNEQFEEATDYIIRFKLALGTGDVAETDQALMESAQKQLLTTLFTQLNNAIEHQQFTEMLRYSKLLDLLDEGEKPLDLCIQYLIQQMTQNYDQNFDSKASTITSQDTGKDCADLLAFLFNSTVQQLNDIENSFIASFPHQLYAYGKLLHHIYLLCDEKANRILDLYMSKKELENINEQGKTILQNIVGQRVGTTTEMLNILDNTLNEISFLLQYIENFDRYIRGRGLALLQSINKKESSASDIPPTKDMNQSLNLFFPSIQDHNNNTVLNSINKYYLNLEEVYLIYNMIQAEMNESIDYNNFVTTYIDDTFFIFKHCLDRVLAQGSVKNLVLIIKYIKGSMEQYLNSFYMSILRGKRTYTEEKLSSYSLPKDRLSLILTINNSFLSLSYLSNIINTLYQESQQVFTTLPTNLKKSIEDLQTTGSKLFNDIYTMGMNRLKELFIQPSFEQFQKLFINTSYDISEAEFNALQLVDPFMVDYTASFKAVLTDLFQYLLPDICENLINNLSKQFASKIEVILYKKKYTLLGGLQFDHDIRLLIQFLKDMKSTTTRTDFAKINQISIILNMDNPKNAFQYFLSDSSSKQLITKHDINTIIKLRVTHDK